MKFRKTSSIKSEEMEFTFLSVALLLLLVQLFEIPLEKINPYNLFVLSLIILIGSVIKEEFFSYYKLEEFAIEDSNGYIDYENIKSIFGHEDRVEIIFEYVEDDDSVSTRIYVVKSKESLKLAEELKSKVQSFNENQSLLENEKFDI